MTPPTRIRTNTVPYRKGFVEVTPCIHKGHVNLESWEVHAEVEISEHEWVTGLDSDEAIIANIEMEFSPSDARKLGNALLKAAEEAEAEQ